MSVKCLSETAQSEIVRFTMAEQYNQTELAELWQVSRRTIQRVLIDHGQLHYNTKGPLPKPDPDNRLFHKNSQQKMKLQPAIDTYQATQEHLQENDEMINILRDVGHTPRTLKDLMNMPALTHRNVELYLTRLPEDDLAKLTYVIGLVRIKMQDRAATEELQKREAANG